MIRGLGRTNLIDSRVVVVALSKSPQTLIFFLSEHPSSIDKVYSSIFSSSSPADATPPPGIRPSFSSFSSRAISCRLLAFRMSTSTRFFSASVSFVRKALPPAGAPLVVLPLREEGMSKVRDFIPIICG